MIYLYQEGNSDTCKNLEDIMLSKICQIQVPGASGGKKLNGGYWSGVVQLVFRGHEFQLGDGQVLKRLRWSQDVTQ